MRIPPIELVPGEELRAEVPANLWRGWESVGGRLYVTDRRLRFESHRWNVQAGPLEIPIGKVESARPRNNLLVIPNGLRVETRAGDSYRFVVWGPRRLAALIRENLPDQSEV